MAATAYASLVSLLNTFDQVRTQPLSGMVDSLVDFVEKYSDADNREVEDLVRRIADAAHYIIEADRIQGRESLYFIHDLHMIIDCIKVKEETGKNPSLLLHQLPAASSAPQLVGFDDYKYKLFDGLLGHDVGRQIISITGKGGMGKTFLARNVYEISSIRFHFYMRVWITVSQDSSARKVYLQALSCLRGGSVDMDTTDQQLGDELYKILYNRRYLIVLDDVRSVKIWDEIKFFFPDNGNGSRIVITTRKSKLFDYIGSSAVAVKQLDEENSWKLFCERTFPRQDFPPKLEKVGKKIVNKCRGLPLTINVIGDFLGKSPRMQKYWNIIARDKSLIVNSGYNSGDNNEHILCLSYNYLPVHLRLCFLYLVLYTEDPDIDMAVWKKFGRRYSSCKATR